MTTYLFIIKIVILEKKIIRNSKNKKRKKNRKIYFGLFMLFLTVLTSEDACSPELEVKYAL